MALSPTTILEVESGGSDTANGGAFDFGQTAGMFTDLAATLATGAAPVVTSASYAFVAGDVNKWIFIAIGTNWTPGWYQIASVSAGAATVNATIGQAVLAAPTITPTTVVGCATTASPTGGTWSMDYSQQTAAQITYTDLATTGTGLVVTSVLNPFNKQHVGNCLVVTGGTNFNVGRYVIVSVNAATHAATVVGPTNISTGIGATGTGGLGGAFASPAKACSILLAAMRMFVKIGTYPVTTASTNVAAGCMSITVNTVTREGYNTYRGDCTLNAALTRPTIIASGISAFTLLNATGTNGYTRNFIFDGAGLTSSRGLVIAGDNVWNVLSQNCTNSAFFTTGGNAANLSNCRATGCSTQPAGSFSSSAVIDSCFFDTNTVTAINLTSSAYISDTVIANNTGATSDGILTASIMFMKNVTIYGSGRDGVRFNSSPQWAMNVYIEGCVGVGFNATSSAPIVDLSSCAAYNNGTNVSIATATNAKTSSTPGVVILPSSGLTNPAAGDYSPNNTVGAGALLRNTGFPGVFPLSTTTGYEDIGAVMHLGSAGGGSGYAGGVFGS